MVHASTGSSPLAVTQVPSQAGGKLFAIPALDKYHIFVSSREQIEEVANAPITQLSFSAAVDEVGDSNRQSSNEKNSFEYFAKLPFYQLLQPHLLFDGFKFDPKDPRHAVPVQALRTQLRDNLHFLTPVMEERLGCVFQTTFPAKLCGNSKWCQNAKAKAC